MRNSEPSVTSIVCAMEMFSLTYVLVFAQHGLRMDLTSNWQSVATALVIEVVAAIAAWRLGRRYVQPAHLAGLPVRLVALAPLVSIGHLVLVLAASQRERYEVATDIAESALLLCLVSVPVAIFLRSMVQEPEPLPAPPIVIVSPRRTPKDQ